MPRVMQVIESQRTCGKGTTQQPFFTATEYHTMGGEFLASTPTPLVTDPLFAASVDLLAACKAILCQPLFPYPEHGYEPLRSALAKVVAAVEKAEGR